MKDRMCEEVRDNGRVCGDHPYSWSQEHGNSVMCIACYKNWLSTKDQAAALKAVSIILADPVAKAKLKEMLKNG